MQNAFADGAVDPVAPQPRTGSEVGTVIGLQHAFLDPNSPSYKGPGYELAYDANGSPVARLSQNPALIQAQGTWLASNATGGASGQPAVPTLNDLNAALATNTPAGQTAPPAGQVTPAAFGAAATARGPAPQAVVSPQAFARPAARATDPIVQNAQAGLVGARPLVTPANYVTPGAQPQPGQPGSESPNEISDGPAQFDQTRVNDVLKSVNVANSGILGIAQNQNDLSLAQAQLAQSSDAARRNALGLARSGNSRDRGLLERQAVSEGSAILQGAGRDAAVLRAQEEDANRKLRLDAYTKAGELGLNTAALQVDVGQLNMTAATSYLNQLFDTQRTGMQIDQQKAEMLTNYIRDMALISKDYYALNTQERSAIRDDLTRRYGIDAQVKTELDKLDAEPGFFEKAALGLISGAGAGGVAIASKVLTSDQTAKTNIADTTDADLAELLSSVKSKTFEYKDPDKHGAGLFLGGMAQDIQKTKLGSAMVKEQPDGYLGVDHMRAGMAALSGLSLVYDRLRKLEESV